MRRPRTFRLVRDHDVSEVSGTGVIADGVRWPDGTVSMRWRGPFPSTVFWPDVASVVAVQGHGGATRLEWDNERTTS